MTNKKHPKRPVCDEAMLMNIDMETDAWITGNADCTYGLPFNGDQYGSDHVRYWNYRKGWDFQKAHGDIAPRSEAVFCKAVQRFLSERLLSLTAS